MYRCELLAPAGELAALEPLIDAGADAVYVGLEGFSSRPQSADLSLEEIEQAVSICRARGVRLHAALNGCVSEERLDAFYDAVDTLDAMGVNAIIASDWGVLARLGRTLRQAEFHASTLLGTYNSRSVRFLQDLGVRRTVFSTNLYLDEMASIVNSVPGMEFEIVADGGICFNDNRICELPHINGGSGYTVYCRQDYRLEHGGAVRPARPIAAKQTSSCEVLDLYLELGIFSFKVEGRTVPYLHILPRIKALRAALDACAGHNHAAVSTIHYVCRRNRLAGEVV